MSGGQRVQQVVISWYNEWWSAGTTSGGPLEYGVAVSWYKVWQSADSTCYGQCVQLATVRLS